jgi:hypothetical protein
VGVVLRLELVGSGVLFLASDPFGGASAIGDVFPAYSFLQEDEVYLEVPVVGAGCLTRKPFLCVP